METDWGVSWNSMRITGWTADSKGAHAPEQSSPTPRFRVWGLEFRGRPCYGVDVAASRLRALRTVDVEASPRSSDAQPPTAVVPFSWLQMTPSPLHNRVKPE